MGARQSNTQRIRRSKYGSDDPFRLSLIFLDSDPEGPWTFHNLTDDDMAAIGGLLAEISYMSWSEIDTLKTPEGKLKHGWREASQLGRRAFSRLEDFGDNRTELADELFRFRVDDRRRIWGFRVENTFYPLWWDPEHTVGKDRNQG